MLRGSRRHGNTRVTAQKSIASFTRSEIGTSIIFTDDLESVNFAFHDGMQWDLLIKAYCTRSNDPDSFQKGRELVTRGWASRRLAGT